ncbi:immunity 8 family protein [Kribbella sp. NPDC048915]|uniref:immunity 8 family protein n=1 Tax=Kribbella sp. NPDC048915 TaxID=3155148 RepID=UPI0033C5714E
MKAVVRSVYSSDVDVESYVPDDPRDAGLWIRLLVGPADGEGEESFDVLVCTPAWLQRVVHEKGPQIGRHHLIVEELEVDEILTFLRHRFEEVEASTWDALAEKLGRIGYWEFEDYRP